jgi:hypothetical protein
MRRALWKFVKKKKKRDTRMETTDIIIRPTHNILLDRAFSGLFNVQRPSVGGRELVGGGSYYTLT